MNTTAPEPPWRIMIAGGSGLLGRYVSLTLLARGHEVIVLSRSPRDVQDQLPGCAVLQWQPGSEGLWQEELNDVDALVDLSGAPVFTKWRGDYYQREVLGSRQTATQALTDAISRTSVGPKVFVSASSLGAYGFRREDESLTEHSDTDIGPLSREALDLEARALQAEAPGRRVVVLRPGVVLAPRGGAFDLMMRVFRRGMGAPVAPGTQWCSWIHIHDAVGLILMALAHRYVAGPLNLTSPSPVRNEEFARAFADATGFPLRRPIPARAFHLLFGKAAITVTQGQRVLPARALREGYEFRYPMLRPALTDLVRQAKGTLNETFSSSPSSDGHSPGQVR